MRFLIGVTILLALKLLGITFADVGGVFVLCLIVGVVVAGVQDINEIMREN